MGTALGVLLVLVILLVKLVIFLFWPVVLFVGFMCIGAWLADQGWRL